MNLNRTQTSFCSQKRPDFTFPTILSTLGRTGVASVNYFMPETIDTFPVGRYRVCQGETGRLLFYANKNPRCVNWNLLLRNTNTKGGLQFFERKDVWFWSSWNFWYPFSVWDLISVDCWAKSWCKADNCIAMVERLSYPYQIESHFQGKRIFLQNRTNKDVEKMTIFKKVQ